MQNFRTLRVYQQAHQFVLAAYSTTRLLPVTERYGLTSQMRRGSISIVSNIAEGAGRGGNDFQRFLRMALRSAFELETQLRLCCDLHLIGPSDADPIVEQISDVQKKLGALIAAIGNSSEPRLRTNDQELVLDAFGVKHPLPTRRLRASVPFSRSAPVA